MKTIALILGVTLAGSAGAQSIDVSAAHDAPLAPKTAAASAATPRALPHALATTMTRVVVERAPDGTLQAVCNVEPNPAGVAAALRHAHTQPGKMD